MDFERSHNLLDRGFEVIPGGISSDVRRSLEHFPLIYDSGTGSRIRDADGNEFIDYVMGWGPLILGHAPAEVTRAVSGQVKRGTLFGGQSEIEIRVAEQIRRMVPCAEQVRFGTSGSESVHAALRLARAVTQRKKIVRFEGHYHGWLDNIAWSYMPPIEEAGPRERPAVVPSSAGQMPEEGANLISLPWNDLSVVETTFRKKGTEIAAVILEPVMHSCGCIAPCDGYLDQLRRICDEWGSLLIFDEVVTGFRLAPGGAQERFGVEPDLVVLGKAMGGGLPVSALAGKKDFMKAWGTCGAILGGTYNGNPLSLAAAEAVLDCLAENDGETLERVRWVASELMEGIREVAKRFSLPLRVHGVPPLFSVFVLKEPHEPLRDYRSFLQVDQEATRDFCMALQDEGIHASFTWFVSAAHTREDIEQTFQAVDRALARLGDRLPKVSRSCQQSVSTRVPERTGVPRGILHRLARKTGLLGYLDHENPDSLPSRIRKWRFRWFEKLLENIPKPVRILDVGGTVSFWERAGWAGNEDYQITILNLTLEDSPYSNIRTVLGRAEDLGQYRDGEFDVGFSNSVIEHLSEMDRQEAMASEIQRVSKSFWIQTPCYSFPVEPHFLIPCWHWMPVPVRTFLLRHFGCGRHEPIGDWEKAEECVREIRYLSRKEIHRLFPGASVKAERIFGLTKSWIILKGFEQPVVENLDREGFGTGLRRERKARQLFEEYIRRRREATSYREKNPAPNHYWAVAWEATHLCNLSCVYCPQTHEKHPDESIEKCLDVLESIQPKFVWMGGGEPALIPDVHEVVRQVKDRCRDPWITFNTNFMAPLEVYERLEPWVDAIYVSLDGFGKDNRKYRGFDGNRLLDRLAGFVADHPKFHWAINTVVSIENYRNLSDITEKIQARLPGITQNFWPLCPTNDPLSVGRSQESREEYLRIVEQVRNRYPNVRYSIPPEFRKGNGRCSSCNPLDRPPRKDELFRCHRQFFVAELMPDGRIHDCFYRQSSGLDFQAWQACKNQNIEDLERLLELLEIQTKRDGEYNPLCGYPCTFWEDFNGILEATSTSDPNLSAIPEISGRFAHREKEEATEFIRKNFNPSFDITFFDHMGNPEDLKTLDLSLLQKAVQRREENRARATVANPPVSTRKPL